VREELQLSQKNVIFNGKRFGCVYSLKASLGGIPDEFQYRLSHRIRRISPAGSSESPYQQIAKTVKAPRERLKLAPNRALMSLRWTGFSGLGQRIAADVLRLRKAGMRIHQADNGVRQSYCNSEECAVLPPGPVMNWLVIDWI
jgi:hypothetical protein